MPIASIFNYIGVIVLVVLVLILVVSNIHVVQQSRAYVVERLGAYSATWNVGLHLKIPFIERVVKKVSLKEQVADFDPQPVITKDNVTMQIDTVIYFQITDPKLYTYGVEHPTNCHRMAASTTSATASTPNDRLPMPTPSHDPTIRCLPTAMASSPTSASSTSSSIWGPRASSGSKSRLHPRSVTPNYIVCSFKQSFSLQLYSNSIISFPNYL